MRINNLNLIKTKTNFDRNSRATFKYTQNVSKLCVWLEAWIKKWWWAKAHAQKRKRAPTLKFLFNWKSIEIESKNKYQLKTKYYKFINQNMDVQIQEIIGKTHRNISERTKEQWNKLEWNEILWNVLDTSIQSMIHSSSRINNNKFIIVFKMMKIEIWFTMQLVKNVRLMSYEACTHNVYCTWTLYDSFC